MSGWVRACQVLGPFLLILSSFSPVALGEGQIRVLAIGQVLPGESPVPFWFDSDPLVEYVLVPTDVDRYGGFGMTSFRRFVRIYFPRTRDELVEGFDFSVFPDGNLDPFVPSQIADIKYAMERGMGGLVTMGGDLSSPSGSAYAGWANSVLREVLPVELNDKMKQDGSLFSIRVVKDEPPVLSMFVPLGIEDFKGASAFTLLTTRIGATVWGHLKSAPKGLTPTESDWLVSWRVGSTGGIFWALADDLDSSWWSPIIHPLQFENLYAGDVFINILLHSVGAPLPEDVFELHDLRSLYSEYNVKRSLLIGLLEFADGFGANTRDAYAQMAEIDELRGGSLEEYRSYNYAIAREIMDSTISELADLEGEAMDLKDRALMWVYVTQWVVVTGTSLACGFAVWTLMIRRRLYREVGTSRLVLRSG